MPQFDTATPDRVDVNLTAGNVHLSPVPVTVPPSSRGLGFVDIVIEIPDDVTLILSWQVGNVRIDGRLGRTEIRTQMAPSTSTTPVTCRPGPVVATWRSATSPARHGCRAWA